ncbi:MAG: hypothetical protein EZS28_040637, partial [Streblomastix strix]
MRDAAALFGGSLINQIALQADPSQQPHYQLESLMQHV